MKISPIRISINQNIKSNNQMNPAFSGLMLTKTNSGSDTSFMLTWSQQYYYYYPFIDETQEEIQKVINSIPQNVDPDFKEKDEYWKNSEQHYFNLMPKLHFTKEQYETYKKLDDALTYDNYYKIKNEINQTQNNDDDNYQLELI